MSDVSHALGLRGAKVKSIALRIALGFGSMLIILAIVSGISLDAFSRVRGSFASAQDNFRSVVHAGKLGRGFEEYRRYVREFTFTNLDGAEQAARKSADGLRVALSRASAEVTDATQKRTLGLFERAFAEHDRDFTTIVVANKNEQVRIRSKILAPLGGEIGTKIDALVARLDGAGDDKGRKAAEKIATNHLMLRLISFKAFDAPNGPARVQYDKLEQQQRGALDALVTIVPPEMRRDAEALRTAMLDYFANIARVYELDKSTSAIDTKLRTNFEEASNQLNALINEADSAADAAKVSVEGSLSSAERFLWTLALGGLALGLMLAWFIGRGISRPIVAITEVMERLSQGDRSAVIPGIGRTDEVGTMAATLEVFKSGLVENDRMRAEQERIKLDTDERRRLDMAKMADAFEAAVGGVVENVVGAATHLRAAAEEMTATAERVSQRSIAVASASEEASTNVETVASAAEELAASISEIRRQADESRTVAISAARDAETTAARVRELSESANRVGQVVDLIDNIASQTNLLALNATIEAARAGEAGRGFAVVAAEVKQLADQTSHATAQISRQIGEIQGSTQSSAAAIVAITEVIERLNMVASGISSAVTQQGAATDEIARNVAQASSGTQEVANNISGITHAARDSSTAAGKVFAFAQDLATQSDTLRSEMARFLASIRAA